MLLKLYNGESYSQRTPYSKIKSNNGQEIPKSIENFLAQCSEGIVKGRRLFTSIEMIEFVIPECVKIIDVQAFYRQRKLRKVVIPEEIESIGRGAFRQCDYLSTIVWNDREYGLDEFNKIAIEIGIAKDRIY